MKRAAHGWAVGLGLAAAVVVAGCGSHDEAHPVTADRLGEPGRQWAAISAHQRLGIARLCRPAAAVAAGRADHDVAAAYLSDRYRAVAAVPDDALAGGLDRWYAHGAHATQRLRDGCAAVARRLAHLGRVIAAPDATFLPPVGNADGPLTVPATGAAARLHAVVHPAAARLTLAHAADRAPTTTTWSVHRAGSRATIDLAAIPRGTSYLRVDVTSRAGHWRRLVVLRRDAAATPAGAPGAAIVLHGDGDQRLPSLRVPPGAQARVRTGDGPLTITSARTIIVAAPAGATAPVAATPGRYAGVSVTADGPWTVTISAAR